MKFVELAKLKEELSRLDLESRDPFNVYRRALDCIDDLLFSIEELEEEMDLCFNENNDEELIWEPGQHL